MGTGRSDSVLPLPRRVPADCGRSLSSGGSAAGLPLVPSTSAELGLWFSHCEIETLSKFFGNALKSNLQERLLFLNPIALIFYSRLAAFNTYGNFINISNKLLLQS